MSAAVTVVVDLEGGEVRFGGRHVKLECTAQPHRFRLVDGRIVRAISFGERSSALRDALAANDPTAALGDLLQGLALDGAPDEVANAVLLALAGGGEPAPGFDACAVEACRLRGWDWRTLNDSAAIHVDRCVQTRSDGGWTRFAFVTPAGADDSSELAAAIQHMTEQLLERAGSGGDSQAVGIEPWDDVPDDRPDDGWMGRPDDSERVHTIQGEPFARLGAQRGEGLDHAGVEPDTSDRTNPASMRFGSQRSGPSVEPRALERPGGQGAQGTGKDREWDTSGAQPLRERALGGLDRAPAQPRGGLSRESDWSGATRHGKVSGMLATFSHPLHASRPGSTGGEPPRRIEASTANPQVEPHLAPPAIDWFDTIAQALADECDLRGID
jgi:hypothetical protein